MGPAPTHGCASTQNTTITAGTAEDIFSRALEQICRQESLAGKQKQQRASIAQWALQRNGQADVQKIVENAQRLYASRQNHKAHTWLAKATNGILYYGQIMDVLVQHHPEYVSLAWGTTKLLFVLFQNHDELITELAKSMSEIADLLPRIEKYIDLAHDDTLERKAEALYVLLLEYFHEMLKFYEEGRFKHIWKSLVQPYAIRLKPLKDQIDRASKSFSEYVRVRVDEVIFVIRDTQTRQQGFQQNQHELQKLHYESLLDELKQIKAMVPALSRELLSLRRIEMTTIVNTSSTHGLQDPNDVLANRWSFCRRHAARLRIDSFWSSNILHCWSNSAVSSGLFVQGSWLIRKELQSIGSSMVKYVHSEAAATALWALQPNNRSQRQKVTWTQILKYLAMQALTSNASTAVESISDGPTALNSINVTSATTATQWECILLKALTRVKLVYIIIDMELLEDELVADRSSSNAMFASIGRLIAGEQKTLVKLALLNQRKSRDSPLVPSDVGLCMLDVNKTLAQGRLRPGRPMKYSPAAGRLFPSKCSSPVRA